MFCSVLYGKYPVSDLSLHMLRAPHSAFHSVLYGKVPVAAVDEKVTQQGTNHHNNMVKLELRRARAKTHRRVLATVTRTGRRCCRPRGRKARTVFPRRSQASRMGRLGAQGASRAMTGFAVTGMRYGDGTSSTEQRRPLDGATAAASGKTGEKNGEKTATVKTL